MRIVIVGGTGNIGTALLGRLRQGGADHDLHVVARRVPTVAAQSHFPGVTWHQADITRDALDPLLSDADAVVHLAWLFQPTHRPDITWANNAVGTARLVEAVRRSDVRAFVMSSSVAAYSPVQDHRAATESWSTHGSSTAAYAREKAYNERLADALALGAPGTRVVRMRPVFVFQRQAAAEQRRLFGGPLVPGSLVRPALVPVLPVPRGLRLQAVHADDVAAAFVSALSRDVEGAYNLAAQDVLTGQDLADLLDARHLPVPPKLVRGVLAGGWHAHVVPAPPRLFDALMSLPMLDTTKARRDLGWHPVVSARDAVASFLDGLRNGSGGETPPLAAAAGGVGRWREFVSGVGQRDGVPR